MRPLSLPSGRRYTLTSIMVAVAILLLQILPTPTLAQNKIVMHEIHAAQAQFHNNNNNNNQEQQQHASTITSSTPFLSATLKTDISPVSTYINQQQINQLSYAIQQFLQHVFDEQDTYDIHIVGVSIYEERILKNRRELIAVGGDKNEEEMQHQYHGRKLPLNSLQYGQFNFAHGYDDDDEYEWVDDNEYNNEATTLLPSDYPTLLPTSSSDGGWDEVNNLIAKEELNEEENKESRFGITTTTNNGDDGGGGYTLTFATVISAEHTTTAQQLQDDQEQTYLNLSHGDFQKTLIHICHKFDSHLVEFIKGIGNNNNVYDTTDDDYYDGYFRNVNIVVVSGYEEDEVGQQGGEGGGGGADEKNDNANDMGTILLTPQQKEAGESLLSSIESIREKYPESSAVDIETLLRGDDNWNAGRDALLSEEEEPELNSLEIVGIVLSVLILVPLIFAAFRLRR